MATPNGLNPTFLGKASAAGFDAIHGKGVSVTAIDTNSSVAVDLFGTTNGFNGSITGIWAINVSGSSNVITIAGTDGTVCTLLTGAVDEAFITSKALSNTTLYASGSMQVVSDGALTGNVKLFVTYKVTG